jgi:hypothetical protein
MAYVTYTNRYSSDYRFTIDTLEDPALGELKSFIKGQKNKGLRIRPRGPRGRRYGYDTPIENATRFDVYVREYK